jgi:hypothetical protein
MTLTINTILPNSPNHDKGITNTKLIYLYMCKDRKHGKDHIVKNVWYNSHFCFGHYITCVILGSPCIKASMSLQLN